MSRPQHPIFNGPFPVELSIEQTKTPPGYYHYGFIDPVPDTLPTLAIFKKEWDSQNLPVGSRPDNGVSGVVTSNVGFLDSPDMESIAGGIHLKGPDYVAIGRQGHVLQWGFYGSPEEMTENGKNIFMNAIHYIAGFRDAPIEALRETPPRDSLAMTLGFLDEYEADRVQGILTRSFGETVPAGLPGADKDARRSWFIANRPYLFYEGPLFGGHYLLDEDAQALSIPNYDLRILDRAVTDLEAGRDADRAHRILKRYTGKNLSNAKEWRTWLDGHRDDLFFSDWFGYRFRSRATAVGTTENPPADPTDVLGTELRAYERDGVINASLKIKIAPEYHVYAPNVKEKLSMPIRVYLPEESEFTFVDQPIYPRPTSGNISGHFTFSLRLKGDGDTLRLLVDYQACTEQFCLPPVTGLEVEQMVYRPTKN